jgi:aminoglycoside 6'-N-acetyltransferase
MLPAVIFPLGIHYQAKMIHLRPATPADLNLLQHWDEQPHVIASDLNDDWGWEVELTCTPDWREQLIAEIDDRPIGFIQIIDPAREDSHYWGEIAPNLRAIDIWIGEATDLGKGYGTQMMQMAIDRCFANPTVTAILVDPLASNTRAHRFYERLGFQGVDRRRFGSDDCLVYQLSRVDWQAKPGKQVEPM